MARSIHIPWLVDLMLVDQLAELVELDADDRVDRVFPARGPLLNRVLAVRLSRHTATRDGPLPAFLARDADGRAEARDGLERRLNQIDVATIEKDPAITELAARVAGRRHWSDVGPVVQGVLGRLFVQDYRADADSWRAARTLDKYLRITPVIGGLMRLSGRVGRANRVLWERADRQPHAVHATGIAVHNIVKSLETMRALMGDPGRRGRVTEDNVVAQCLAPPNGILRGVREPVQFGDRRDPLRPGGLVLIRLADGIEGTADVAAAFHVDSWAQCPAHGYVPALLRAVWRRSVAEGESR